MVKVLVVKVFGQGILAQLHSNHTWWRSILSNGNEWVSWCSPLLVLCISHIEHKHYTHPRDLAALQLPILGWTTQEGDNVFVQMMFKLAPRLLMRHFAKSKKLKQ